MKIRNEQIITDTSRGKINTTDKNLFCGPMKLGDIEAWEDACTLKGTPYVLTYGETTIPLEFYKRGAEGMTFKAGYFLYKEKV